MKTETWVITTPQDLAMDGVVRVVAQLNDGSIEIIGDPGRSTGAEVRVTSLVGRPLTITHKNDELRVGYDFRGVEGLVDRVRALAERDRVTVQVVVGVATPVTVRTASAATKVTGVNSPVGIASARGSVNAHGVTGALDVKTAAGNVAITEHTGDLRVVTTSGDLDATGILGRVSVTTGSGNVALGAGSSTPMVDVRTVSGDVVVRLAAGRPVSVRARSITGEVSLDGQPLTGGSNTTSVVHTESPGTPGAYVSTNTVSGDLTVIRA